MDPLVNECKQFLGTGADPTIEFSFEYVQACSDFPVFPAVIVKPGERDPLHHRFFCIEVNFRKVHQLQKGFSYKSDLHVPGNRRVKFMQNFDQPLMLPIEVGQAYAGDVTFTRH